MGRQNIKLATIFKTHAQHNINLRAFLFIQKYRGPVYWWLPRYWNQVEAGLYPNWAQVLLISLYQHCIDRQRETSWKVVDWRVFCLSWGTKALPSHQKHYQGIGGETSQKNRVSNQGSSPENDEEVRLTIKDSGMPWQGINLSHALSQQKAIVSKL